MRNFRMIDAEDQFHNSTVNYTADEVAEVNCDSSERLQAYVELLFVDFWFFNC